MTLNTASRRHFLRTTAMTATAGAAAPLALNLSLLNAASAATATDYKAVICFFMYGGNDSFNTLVATDPDSWREYKRWRDAGSQPLSLPAVGQPGGLIPISPATAILGRTFALNPRLSNMAAMFNAKRLALVSNVGPTSAPLDPRNYATGVQPFLPFGLFSHNDQQSVWQSGRPEGASYGWGGRMGDILASGNGSQTIFTTVSTQGASTLLSGLNTLQYTVGPSAGAEIKALKRNSFGSTQSAAILNRIVTRDSNHLFEKEAASVTRRAIVASSSLSGAALPVGLGGVPTPSPVYNPISKETVANPLAVQLQTVARIIGGSASLGLKRQLFMVGLGGFDNHSNQMPDHEWAMTQIDHAMGYLDSVLANLDGRDVRRQVTLFSASDFGRTFSSNGNGTDHGWGAHHFIYGGAVKGGDIYGDFPISGVGHLWDYGKGVLLPQIGVDQYAATLGAWLGLSPTQLVDVLPNLSRFSKSNLGFF
jgi:uncharacterized protein (DUF1501 family)